MMDGVKMLLTVLPCRNPKHAFRKLGLCHRGQ
jgi:hypothetical protein